MKYVSTRGDAPTLGFDDVVLTGLASDGGLYVPEQWPEAITMPDPATGYAAVAAAVLAPFVEGSSLEGDLGRLTASVYSQFDHPEVAPLVPVGDRHHLLELFWGPTLSFKDYALALVGAMFDRILSERGRRALVLGATSGDTGSAAMAALAGMDAVDVVILFPDGRVSEVQRRQMTTLDAHNTHAVAIDGTFDDCQDLVKAAFSSPLRHELGLAAVNSINWARIAAQTVYHVWATLRVGTAIGMAVPTGNFGNVLSALVARRLGAPIRSLILANNANHGMFDLVETGRLSIEEIAPTPAPAMDIAVPSNLERYLFDAFGRDAVALRQAMELFRKEGLLVLDEISHAALRSDFRAGFSTDAEIEATMAEVAATHGIVIDPHTATAWRAGRALAPADVPLVTVATAHPAKFAGAVERAVGQPPPRPPRLAGLGDRPERLERMEPDLDVLADHLRRVSRG